MDPELVERYGPVRAARMVEERRAGIRRAALRRLAWTVPLPALAVGALVFLDEARRGGGLPGKALGTLAKWAAPIAAVTAVPLLVAVLEAVAGYEVRELAARWDALAGWQRGVVGTLAAAGALALFGTIAFAVATSLAG